MGEKKTDGELLAQYEEMLSDGEQGKWESGGYYGEAPQSMTEEEWQRMKAQLTPEEIEAFDELNEQDIGSWESGDLGKNPAYLRRIAPEAAKEFREAKKTMMPPTLIRLPEELRDALKQLADSQGLSYQAYVRRILTLHVEEKLKGPRDVP